MTRHGWYEWRPDTRDERLGEIEPAVLSDELRAEWCESCERFVPVAGCPACGTEHDR